MNSYTKAFYTELEHLAEDSQALLTATADVAEHKVVEARKRLTAALEKSKQAWARMQQQATEGAQAADEAIRRHPYRAIGTAFGVGVVLGCLLRHRN
jgi:ElaB/YqjD/DUF883 family membrane-anchored ribosome-binding protein